MIKMHYFYVFARTNVYLPLFTLLPRETVWKIVRELPNRASLGAQNGKMGPLRTVFVVAESTRFERSGDLSNSLRRCLLGNSEGKRTKPYGRSGSYR
jgi:hypothetical protein